jgi:hypothetical protein
MHGSEAKGAASFFEQIAHHPTYRLAILAIVSAKDYQLPTVDGLVKIG